MVRLEQKNREIFYSRRVLFFPCWNLIKCLDVSRISCSFTYWQNHSDTLASTRTVVELHTPLILNHDARYICILYGILLCPKPAYRNPNRSIFDTRIAFFPNFQPLPCSEYVWSRPASNTLYQYVVFLADCAHFLRTWRTNWATVELF